ncbi:hypothetical protein AABM26_08180 [Curtobacterium aetherium]|uniref:hypothetical protein n=1 Tax=Curtobacterium aetherium TaxID=2841594 RepID=UPI003B518F8B
MNETRGLMTSSGRSAVLEAQRAAQQQSVGYRAVLRLPVGTDAVQLAEQEVRAWLLTKTRPRRSATLDAAGWEGSGDFVLGPHAVLSVTDRSDERGQVRRQLIRLVERNNGSWIVSVYALTSGTGRSTTSALVIETGRVSEKAEDSVLTVAPPRIVGQILDRVEVRDGSARLTNTPQVVRQDEVGDLIDVLTDDARSTSVIVASSLGAETDSAWTKTVESLTQYSVGVASVYVMTHDAVAEFNSLMPASHAVQPGRIRTFAPSVDLEAAFDSVRHRVLGPSTFARAIRRGKADVALRATHASGIRRRLLELELPKDVRRTMRLLLEEEARRARGTLIDEVVSEELGALEVVPMADEGRRSGASDASDASDGKHGEAAPALSEPVPARTGALRIPMDWAPDERSAVSSTLLRRAGAFVLRWLKVTDPREEHFDELDKLIGAAALEKDTYERLFAEAGDRESDLSDRIKDLNSRIADLEVEAAIEADEARKAARERDWLRRSLDADQRARFAPVDDESLWEAPVDVRELVARLTAGTDAHPARDRVVFTGNEDIAAEIDERDGTGRYAAALWSYVRVLYDYVDAKKNGHAGNVHMYLSDDAQAGTKCSPDRHAATESTTVINNKKMHSERMRPVPLSVDASGAVPMLAHFKPTHRDRFAPRMHYFDDSDRSGMIYIGYIGRHLTTPNAH